MSVDGGVAAVQPGDNRVHGARRRSAELAEQVYRRLKQEIHGGQLPPGLRLVERAIARAKGVSRTPVREALRRLHDEGLVEYRPGRGMVVASLSTEDLAEIYALREQLEGLAVREAARRRTEADLQALAAILQRAQSALAQGDLEGVRATNEEFHRHLVTLSGMRHLQRLVAQLRDRIEFYRRRSLELPGRPVHTMEEHRLLLETLRQGDPDLAEAAMRLHLRRAREAAQRWGGHLRDTENGLMVRSRRRRRLP